MQETFPIAVASATREEYAPERSQLPDTKWEFITPDLAEEYLEFNEGNRRIRKDTVDTYSRDLQDGNWLITGDAIRFDVNGRLIDGQHRLKAISQSRIGAWTLVVRGVAPQVQMVLDTQARRSAADALRFAGVERNPHLVASIARAAITYDDFLKNELCKPFVNTAAPSNSEVENWVRAHPEVHEAATLANHLHKASNHGLTSWGLSVIKLTTLDPVDGRDFFLSLANMQTNGPGDPRHTLLQFTPSGKGRGRIALGEMLVAITVAWNAYRKDEELKQIKTKLNGKFRDIPVAVV